MTHNLNESIAEGLAIIAEGIDSLEGTPDASSRHEILVRVRSVILSLAEIVGEPQALAWSQEPQWVSMFTNTEGKFFDDGNFLR